MRTAHIEFIVVLCFFDLWQGVHAMNDLPLVFIHIMGGKVSAPECKDIIARCMGANGVVYVDGEHLVTAVAHRGLFGNGVPCLQKNSP